MFSIFSDLVEKASSSIKAISDEVERWDVESSVSPTTDTPNPGTTILTAAQLLTVPPRWDGNAEEWRLLIEAALQDLNTCATGPQKLQQNSQLWGKVYHTACELLAASGDAKKSEEEVAQSAETLLNNMVAYSPGVDLVDMIATNPKIHQMWSDAVPRYISDDAYWLNIGWRLNLYQLCRTVPELLHLMRLLSSLPLRVAGAVRKETEPAIPEAGGPAIEPTIENPANALPNGSSVYWDEVERQWNAIREHQSWLHDMEERIRKEIELSDGNVKLLGSLLERLEAKTSLGESVFESCEYHKVKQSRLLSDISIASPDRTEGTSLDMRTGAVFLSLMESNGKVKRILDAYHASSTTVSAEGKSLEPSPSKSMELGTAGVADVAQSEPRNASPLVAEVEETHSHTSTAGSAGVEEVSDEDQDDDDKSFEAKLPW